MAMHDNKDRLNEMFKALRRRGLVARQNFSCCGGCGAYELGEVVKEKEKRGAVFYHRQDADALYGRGWGSRPSHSVFLAYGANPDMAVLDGDDERNDVKVGRDIVECAAEVGLEVKWNGSRMQRVEVLLPGGIYGGRE